MGSGMVAFAMTGPRSAVAQTASPAEEGEEQTPPVEEAIEWNFERVPVTSPQPAVPLQERWAAPFAVISRGRLAPREPRQVVVVRADSAVATGPGETAAEVTVERGSSAGESASSPTGAGDSASEPGGQTVASADAETAESSGSAAARATAARVAERSATPSPAVTSGPRTHRVEFGETWYGLARLYRVSSRDLAAANPGVDPERLRAGTVLRIPSAGAASAAPRTHTVSRGDTLFGIARRYGVSAAAIRSANRMTDDVVRLGQTLVIPPEEASR